MCNYANDCSPYEISLSFINWRKIPWYLEWYESNNLKPNPDKWEINMLSKLEIKLSQTVQTKKS